MNQLDPQQAEAMRQASLMNATARLANSAKSGISNFYWIAGLSLVNSAVDMFGGGYHFIAGLGITQVIDAFGSVFSEKLVNIALAVRGLEIALDIIIMALFVLFGYLGLKGRRWAIVTGIVLYGLDSILMLVFQDWIGFAFHLFFLWGLWGGLRASDQLRKLLLAQAQTQAAPAQTSFPSDIGAS